MKLVIAVVIGVLLVIGIVVLKRTPEKAIVGVAEEKLFCLVIGRSIDQAVTSLETRESLQRFSGVISEVLKKDSK